MPITDAIRRENLPQISENPLRIVPCDADIVQAEGIVVIDFSKGDIKSRTQFRGESGAAIVATCEVIDGWKFMYNVGSNRVFVPANQNGNPVRDFIGMGAKDCVAEIVDIESTVDVFSVGGLRSLAYQLTQNDISVSAVDFLDETIADVGLSVGESVLAEFGEVRISLTQVANRISTTQIAILLVLAAALGFGAAVVAKRIDKNSPTATDTSTAP